MPEAKSERLWTYKDYLGWVEDERWELIEGKAYNMTPAPTWHHQQVVGELFFQIRSALEGHTCKIVASPIDVRLAEPNTADIDIVNVVVDNYHLISCQVPATTPLNTALSTYTLHLPLSR
jgi:hypothetical protein